MSLNANKTVWQGANCLLAIAIFLGLFISCFVGEWGLINAERQIFWPSVLIYFSAKLLSLRWLFGIWFCLAILVFYLPINYPFYFIGLILAIFLINQKPWPWWFFAPIAVHLIGILSFVFIDNDLFETAYKFNSLSKYSLIAELIMVYPLAFLGVLFSRFLDWFRYFE